VVLGKAYILGTLRYGVTLTQKINCILLVFLLLVCHSHHKSFLATNDLQDVRDTFALPIVSAVWNKVKVYHDPKFVHFMESKVLDKNKKV